MINDGFEYFPSLFQIIEGLSSIFIQILEEN
jgi:hypothetical protein